MSKGILVAILLGKHPFNFISFKIFIITFHIHFIKSFYFNVLVYCVTQRKCSKCAEVTLMKTCEPPSVRHNVSIMSTNSQWERFASGETLTTAISSTCHGGQWKLSAGVWANKHEGEGFPHSCVCLGVPECAWITSFWNRLWLLVMVTGKNSEER